MVTALSLADGSLLYTTENDYCQRHWAHLASGDAATWLVAGDEFASAASGPHESNAWPGGDTLGRANGGLIRSDFRSCPS